MTFLRRPELKVFFYRASSARCLLLRTANSIAVYIIRSIVERSRFSARSILSIPLWSSAIHHNGLSRHTRE